RVGVCDRPLHHPSGGPPPPWLRHSGGSRAVTVDATCGSSTALAGEGDHAKHGGGGGHARRPAQYPSALLPTRISRLPEWLAAEMTPSLSMRSIRVAALL